jgi:hypothetical protein
MKRLLYALLIILGIIAIVAIGYLFRYRGVTNDTNTPEVTGSGTGIGTLPENTPGTTTGGTGGTQGAGSGTPPEGALPTAELLNIVVQQPSLAYGVEEGSIVTVGIDGKVSRWNGSQEESLSAAPIPDITAASFAPGNTKAIALVGKEETTRVSVFDLAQKTWESLPEAIFFAAWAPSGERLVTLANTSRGVQVAVRDIKDMKKQKEVVIKTLPLTNGRSMWVGENTIALWDKPSYAAEGFVILLDAKTGAVKNTITDIFGPLLTTHPSGTYTLLFEGDKVGRGGRISLGNTLLTTKTLLSFNTMPSMCGFQTNILESIGSSTTPSSTSSSTKPKITTSTEQLLFCEIPTDQNAFVLQNLPDAYLMRGLNLSGPLYRINIETGDITLLGDGSERLDIEMVEPKKDALYFISRTDHKVYRLTLPKQG